MLAKAALAVSIFICLPLSYYLLFGTIDFRSQLLPLLQAQPLVHSHCPGNHPLRVYMYELPRRFHLAMLDHRSSGEEPVTAANFPHWPAQSGLNKQHSVEYWMMASLLYEGEGTENDNREAVRVLDPEMADVFFVPFFSSLSFNVHGHHMTDPETEIDRKLQIDLLNILWGSKYWQRSLGHDHVIPMHHPNAFRFLREKVNASILIVSDFGRYSKSMSNLRKDVVAPYVHVVNTLTDDNPPDPFGSRPILLFFRGRTVRKDEGKVRAKLASILAGHDDVIYEQSFASTQNIKLSTEGMRFSKFCLHPAGDTPSSCRLFDAIVSHCVPVIVSDKIELPFEDKIDYTEFSLFFSAEEASRPDYMVNELRRVPKDQWMEMWARLKNVSRHYEFQNPPKEADAVSMIWRQVRDKLPSVNLFVHRNKRLKIPEWWTS